MTEEVGFDTLPIPLAELPPGFFWMRSTVLGLTDEECAMLARGEMLPDRRRTQLQFRIERARSDLTFAFVSAARV